MIIFVNIQLLPATKSHFLNMQQAHAFSNQQDLASLRDKIDRTEYKSKLPIFHLKLSNQINLIHLGGIVNRQL